MKNQIVIPSLDNLFFKQIKVSKNENDIRKELFKLYEDANFTCKIYNQLNDPDLHRDENF